MQRGRPLRSPVRWCLLALLIALQGCSTGQMLARTSTAMLDGAMVAMFRETDLELARQAMPANLKMLEGLVEEDPANATLRNFTAQGFYGYTYSFVEDDDPVRASALYRRCLAHAVAGLRASGLRLDPLRARVGELERAVAGLGPKAVPGLFWAASCWAKWIDHNREDMARISEMAKAAALMQRALELDEGFFYGGPHLFFAVYYGSRAPMLGGDYARSAAHFAAAERLAGGKLYLVDVLYAQYLARQQQDRDAFDRRLHGVLEQAPDAVPELALLNRVAQEKARRLLQKEAEWF